MSSATTTSHNKRRRQRPLPKWATIHKAGKQRPQDVTVEKEETILRQMTFRRNVEQPLERAHTQAWNDIFANWQSDLQALLSKNADQNNHHHHHHHHHHRRRRQEEVPSTSEYSHWIVQPSYRYNNKELLPLAIFASPPSICDRQMMMRCFQQFWNRVEPRTISIYLPGLRTSVQSTLELLFHLCLEQEREQPLARFLKRKTKSIPSYTDLLVLWARHTRSYDAILVCLEDSGDYSTQQLRQDFIEVLKDLRSNHQIPISLVLCANTQQADWSQSIVQMTSSFLVKNFAISATHVARLFWKHYSSSASTTNDNDDDSTMISLPPSWILQVLGRDFAHHHRSVSELVRQFNILAVEQYQERGAWLGAAAHNQQFPQLTAWFSTYISSKEFLSLATGHQKLQSILTLHSLYTSRQKILHCLQMLEEAKLSTSPLFESDSDDDADAEQDNPSFLTTRRVLQILYEIRQYIQKDNDSSSRCQKISTYLAPPNEGNTAPSPEEDVVKEALLDEVNELIVLVAHSNSASGNSTIDSNSKVALYEVAKKMWHLFDDLTRKLEDENILLPKSAGDCWEWRLQSIGSNSRTELLTALNNAPSRLENGKYSAKILYKLLQESSNVGRDDLFRKFVLVVDEHGKANKTTLVKKFMNGIWLLYQLGLMNMGRSQKKGGFTYEKTAATWT